MKQIRAFIGIPIIESLRDRLIGVMRQMHGRTRIKWVEKQNLHITVKFLGDIEMTAASGISAVLEESVEGISPFECEVGGIGAFPRPGNPRVIWVGAKDAGQRIAKIYYRLNEQLAPFGVAREKRGFVPHITLGRVRSRADTELVEQLSELADISFGTVTIDEIVLMMSELTRSGPLYTRLATVTL